MTLGAVVIPLVALAVCFGGMWLAWRLVNGAAREGGETPDVPPQAVPTQARPARRGGIGRVIALAAMALGLGGMALIAARLAGADAPLLVAAAVAIGFALLGAGCLALLSRRRHSEAPQARGLEDVEEGAR